MKKSVQCRHASHTNVVIEHFNESVKHLEDVFGGSFMLDLPGDNWHACLMEIGGFIVELFEPKHFMLHGRVGPHFLGIEYEANMDEARAAVASHGIRITRDIQQAFHTSPFDCLGADFEFFGGSFYGPDAKHVKTHTKSPDHWAAHPIGYSGFVGYTHAVVDIDAASRFLQSFLSAQPLYEAERPSIGARAIGLKIANVVCELISPTEDGSLRSEMMTTGHGIRSMLYGVNNIEKTVLYFEDKGVRVVTGTSPERVAVDPRDNLGIMFEFAENN